MGILTVNRWAAAIICSVLVFGHGGGGPAARAASIAAASAPADATPVRITVQDLKYRDPKPLQDLMALSDSDYQDQLTNNWPYVESVLHLYIPANVTFISPGTPLGFLGPWNSCMKQHGLLACREHMRQLISLMNSKKPGQS